jgi:hypothetical protein
LTLPSDTLMQAERIAPTRKMNLSAVVSEILSDGLREHAIAERGERILRAYKKAFAGFSDQEMLILMVYRSIRLVNRSDLKRRLRSLSL